MGFVLRKSAARSLAVAIMGSNFSFYLYRGAKLTNKNALITGISGQDGGYLSEL